MTNPATKWEIERKFVAKNIPASLLEPRTPVKIRQGYLSHSDDSEIRIRDKSGSYTMTVKQGSGLKRLETEVDIDAEQFEALWPLTQGSRIDKLRYKIPYFGQTLEVDVFAGALTSLVIVEVEFTSEEESRDFLPPDFVNDEVTTNSDFKNLNLARNGLPD